MKPTKQIKTKNNISLIDFDDLKKKKFNKKIERYFKNNNLLTNQ